MLEHRKAPLLSRRLFLLRMAAYAGLSFSLVVFSLALGVLGYHWVAGLPWLDALLNASMILTGMGPVDPMPTSTAKVFASCYALFSGVIFLSSVAVLIAPMFHRFLHRFHLEQGQK